MKNRSLALTGLLALLLGLIGCRATTTIDAARLTQKGQIYFEAGHLDEAINILNQALDADFENPATHYWLGQCFQQQGNFTKAIIQYEQAVRFAPAMDIGQIALINAYHQTDQIDRSVQATRLYVRNKSNNAADLVLLAQQFAGKDMHHQAVVAFQRAQAIEPQNAQPSLALAEYYFKRGEEDKAVKALVAAFRADNRYPGLAARLADYGIRVELPEPPLFPKPSPVEEKIRDLDL